MTTKKPYSKPELTVPTEPDYDAELTKLEGSLLTGLNAQAGDTFMGEPAEFQEHMRRTIASHLALAFSLGCHYGYRYAGGSEPVGPGIISFGEEDTHDPAGEPPAR